MLGGHDPALLHHARQPGRMDPCDPLPGDPDAAHPIQPVKQGYHVGRCRSFGGVTQPGEAGAPHGWIGHEQAVECRLLGLGDHVPQKLESSLAGARAGGEANPFQHRGVRHQHAADTEMGEHGLNDWLATVGGPSGTSADPQAVAPVAQSKAAKAQDGLQFDRVFTARLVAPGIVGKGRGQGAELGGHEVEECRGRLLARTKALAWMAQ